MKNLMRRGMALLLALFLCLSLLPTTLVSAGVIAVDYVYDSTGRYIYNWGTRGVTATFLSQNADAFYTGSNTYDALSALSGGTSKDNAPSSGLYAALQNLMAGAHSYQTSYEATKNLYQYTDCQNGGGKISSFYSGQEIGPSWDGAWNREHTWPNSKGLAGADENDIMMLRPTASTENSARGNTAYGQSAGYYHPNSASNYTLDLRGDVARIFLYVYVRWGNVNGNGEYDTWGTRGVIESPEVMLEWIEDDPVDTWELGRNDSVQSITGTRNVFVDYPELAFLLFGEDVPNGMTTPSGKAATAVNCQHNYEAGTVVEATCTTDGYTVYTCTLCSKSYQGDKVAASHKFVSGICSTCGEVAYGVVDAPVPGTAYKFGMIQENKSKTDVYYLKGGMANTYYLDTTTDKEAALDVYLEQTTGGYYFYTYINGAKTYINMVVSGTHVNGVYAATASTVYTYDSTNKTLIAQVNGEPYWFGTRNDRNYTTVGPCATSYKGFYCQFYGNLGQSGGETPDVPSCQHTNTTTQGAKDATCTENGHTGKTVCSDCGVTINEGSVITAPGHNYVEGTCSVCGEKASVEGETTTATITFDNKAKRTEFTTSKQVWEENGIAVINEKGSSTSNVGDYYKPARFYKSSNLKIEYPGMTQIEFACNTAAYATSLKNSIGAAATVSGKVVTVVFAEPTDSYAIKLSDGQTRVDSITVTAAGAGETPEPSCEHTNTATQGAKDATCTENGHTGKTVCSDCDEIINEGSVITAPGHNYVGGACSVCGEKAPVEDETTTATITFNDKAKRTEYSVTKQVWEENGITVTNEKGSSTSNVGDYFNPARFYASSNLKIEYPGMTQIEFNCYNTTYANALKNSITGATVTISSKKVTVTFAEPEDSFSIGKMSAQVRVSSITVTAAPAQPACEHTNTTVEGAKGATCTEDGFTGKVTCNDCGEVIDEGDVVPAPGHKYENYFCSGCGQVDPEAPKYDVYFLVPQGVDAVAPMVSDPKGITLPTAGTIDGYTFLGWVADAVDNVTEQVECLQAGETYVAQKDVVLYALYRYEKTTVVEPTSGTATISFANKAQRTEFNTGKQVWQQNGITVTNLKAASSSNVADYANPARFYASSSLKIEHPGMTKIEFTCDSSKYANALKNSISGSTVSGSKVTVTFSEPQDNLDIAKLSAQVRMKSFTVTYSVPGSQEIVTYYTTVIGDACIHKNTTVGQKDATCTEAGYKDALVCSDCNAVLSGEVVAALGHEAGAEATCETAQTCTRCDHVLVEALGHEAGAEATCETAQICIRCDYVFAAALGHEAGAEATCETAQTCIRCDHVFVAALGHEAGAEATCETAQTCTRCDYVFVEALGHEAGAEATCETAQTCIRCDHVFAEALGHKAGAEATCKTAQTCTRCEKVLVAALGHKAGAAATCKTAQTCTRCDYVFEAALGHNMAKYVAKEPTCTQSGWEEYEACTRCDYSTRKEIAAKGHSYEPVITEPTCTEEGFTTNTCSACGDINKSDTVKALGHKLGHVEAKAATTEAEGNVEYWHCETCQGMWTDEACTKSTTKDAVTVPKLKAPANDVTTTVGATDKADDKASFPWVGGLVVLAVLAVVVLLGVKKFGKK